MTKNKAKLTSKGPFTKARTSVFPWEYLTDPSKFFSISELKLDYSTETWFVSVSLLFCHSLLLPLKRDNFPSSRFISPDYHFINQLKSSKAENISIFRRLGAIEMIDLLFPGFSCFVSCRALLATDAGLLVDFSSSSLSSIISWLIIDRFFSGISEVILGSRDRVGLSGAGITDSFLLYSVSFTTALSISSGALSAIFRFALRWSGSSFFILSLISLSLYSFCIISPKPENSAFISSNPFIVKGATSDLLLLMNSLYNRNT